MAEATQTDLPPPPPEHHRRVQGGAARAAVFGISDGLVTNVGLILGVAGANPSPGIVRLAGLTGLIAGAISMAAGEYNSMRVQTELLEHEIEMERIELHRNPAEEHAELSQLYQSRGIPAEQADELAEAMMTTPELALETHAREELGVDPNELGSPIAAAFSSLAAFSVGAAVPLLPWFVTHGTAAIVGSLLLATVVAVLVGVGISRFTERTALRTVVRQVLLTLVPAAITWLIGRAAGVNGL